MTELSPQETFARLAELLAPYRTEVIYPESDGEPMAETEIHREQMTDAVIYPLKKHLRGKGYVTGNLLFYYREGDPRASVAPDAFVILGHPDHRRRIYKLWEEKRVPDVVFELTSESTRDKDLGEKRRLYESLGVQEYFLFDPLGEYLEPPLRGFRLRGGYFAPLEPGTLPDGDWALLSEVLGLQIETSPDGLRFWNPETETYLLTPAEEAEARLLAEAQAVEAEARAMEAEGRAVEAEARTMEAEDRAMEAEDRAKAAEQRAAQEAEARFQAETEIARLRALLTQSGQTPE